MKEKEEEPSIMHIPCARKSQAVLADRRLRKRTIEMGKRKGKQVTPAEFTRHLEKAHAQQDCTAIPTTNFKIPKEMVEGRMERLYKEGSQIRRSD